MYWKGDWYRKAGDGVNDKVCEDHDWINTSVGLKICRYCAMPKMENCPECKKGRHGWLKTDVPLRVCGCCGYDEGRMQYPIKKCAGSKNGEHHFKWTGKSPCTGKKQCVYCGYVDVEEEIQMGGRYGGHLKYPSMTGQDPMFQMKKEGHMGELEPCNCSMCRDARSEREKIQNEEVEEMGKALYVFKIVAVDKQKCEVVKEATVIGGEQDKGLLELDLNADQKEQMRQGRLQIFTSNVGSFERFVAEVSLTEKFTE